MKIGYKEEDNNKKVQTNFVNRAKKFVVIGLASIAVVMGSGALQVYANEIDTNTTWNAEKQFYFEKGRAKAEAEKVAADRIVAEQIGYDAYINGEDPEKLENIDTMAELDAYQKGIERAEDSGIMQEKWEQMGYDFISQGKLSESLDYDSKITNKLALEMDAYQKGIKKALEEGNIVDPHTIIPLDENIQNPTPEQENLEVYRKMLLEGWVEMGRESVGDVDYFSNKPVSSLADRYFAQRGMGDISASSLINAGREQGFKEKDNSTISLNQFEELAEEEKMSNVKDAENAVKNITKDKAVEQEMENSL